MRRRGPPVRAGRAKEVVVSQVTRPISTPGTTPHATGIAPFRSIGEVAAEIAADVMRRQQTRRLWARGDRLVHELLAEIGARFDLVCEIDGLVGRYLEIPDEALDIVGGRELAPTPLTAIGG